MSDLKIEPLLQEISAEAPCGDDLEYDSEFQEMERATVGKPETQFSEAEPPNWKIVKQKALGVLKRTRDFRPLMHIARASLHTKDWETFSDCMTVMARWSEQFWDHVHPQIDPAENDPDFRVSSIAVLSMEATQFNTDTFIRALRAAPIVSSPQAGEYSLRDIDIALGKLDVKLEDDEQAPSETLVNAAFAESSSEQLLATAAAITNAIDGLQQTQDQFTTQLDIMQAPDFSAIIKELNNAQTLFQQHLQARGLDAAPSDAMSEDSTAANEENTEMSDNPAVVKTGPNPNIQGLSGDITSREDVVRALDKICDYYKRYEPSSPIPILLERAKRLATKSFVEILQDLAPSALADIDALGGTSKGKGD